MKLYQKAKLIRSKNAGPFMITLDVIFPDSGSYEQAAASPALSRANVARLYGVPEEKMQRYLIPLAHAIKFSYPRRHPSGDFLDTDLYGCQQHRPLIELELSDPS